MMTVSALAKKTGRPRCRKRFCFRLLAVALCALFSKPYTAPVLAEEATPADPLPPALQELREQQNEAQERTTAAKGLEMLPAMSAEGNGIASYLLYRIYSEGLGVVADPVEARAYLELAVEQGSPEATFTLGQEYLVGEEPDVSWGLSLVERAVELGDPMAQFAYGKYLEHVQFGLKRDIPRAYALYEKSAQQDYSRALALFGAAYSQGWHVAVDYKRAFNYVKRAAELGYAPGQHALGLFYYEGVGTEIDMAQAAYWYRMGAEQDNPESLAAYGHMLAYGLGVAQDVPLALEHFRRSAELGYAAAWFFMAEVYRDGRGVSRDYGKAAELFKEGAKRGDPEAQVQLGWAYESGQGVAQDFVVAKKWYELSAQQGNAPAMGRLAGLYVFGKGTSPNPTLAYDTALQAANLGDAYAMVVLSNLYINQLAGKSDPIEAAKWTRLVMLNGDEKIWKLLEPLYGSLLNKLAPEQSEELERRLIEWEEAYQSKPRSY